MAPRRASKVHRDGDQDAASGWQGRVPGRCNAAPAARALQVPRACGPRARSHLSRRVLIRHASCGPGARRGPRREIILISSQEL